MNVSPFLFSKQFYLTNKPNPPEKLTHWLREEVSNDLTLYTHPKLNKNVLKHNDTTIIGLGDLINPYRPNDSNIAILKDILSNTQSFKKFEENVYKLGGRWILILLTSFGRRIYHDACGLKTVFFLNQNKNIIAVGSQPALLESLGDCKKQISVVKDFERYKNSGSWPIGILPYSNVQQLIANHYLSLDSITTHRYWPIKKRKLLSIETVAKKLSIILRGTIDALTKRNTCTMSITGGYDSRMLFSCATKYLDRINFFTTVSDFTPEYDKTIPIKISKKFNLPHQFTTKRAQDTENLDVLSGNVGNLFYDRSMGNIFAFKSAI